MGTKLVDADEGVHEVGTASNWNESRYVDFWDAGQRLGGWFRIGNRVNEGHAEMSACLYLPDGRIAFFFERPNHHCEHAACGIAVLGDPRAVALEPGPLFRRVAAAQPMHGR